MQHARGIEVEPLVVFWPLIGCNPLLFHLSRPSTSTKYFFGPETGIAFLDFKQRDSLMKDFC